MSATLEQHLRLEAVFSLHGDDEESAYAALTELIDRLNQVANLPECECDLRIRIERGTGPGAGHPGLPEVADPAARIEAARL